MADGILVILDPRVNRYHKLNMQLIGEAIYLAEGNGQEITVLYTGEQAKEYYEDISRYGMNRMICVKQPITDEYRQFSKSVIHVIEKSSPPKLVIFPDSDLCRLAASITATRLGCALTAECIELRYENGEYIFVRTALGSSCIAEINAINCEIAMCTVKNNVFNRELQIQKEKECVLEWIDNEHTDTEVSCQLVKKILLDNMRNVDIGDKKVLIGAGRGVDPAVLELIRDVSKRLKIELACTRPMVENQLMPRYRQVGQSGICVKPDLYIAVGISGASQHIVGIKDAKKVIAINKDRNAPIFQVCDIGIVADAKSLFTDLLNCLSSQEVAL
jgi:electron transfer flavoprotein alpha subunit